MHFRFRCYRTPEQAADLARLARGMWLAKEGVKCHQAHGWRVGERQRQRKAELAQQAWDAARQRPGRRLRRRSGYSTRCGNSNGNGKGQG